MDVFSAHTYRLNISIYTLSKSEKRCFWDDEYEAKNIHAYTKRESRFVG